MIEAQVKPLVSANQVTFARLVLMPGLAWVVYQGVAGLWIALVLGTLIGLTDALDGYLARKYGPTVLGGLMDPIADKIFIAMMILPLCDRPLLLFPVWGMALLFVREILITALRTGYELRDVRLKTSYLAKVKTWVQMQGLGTIILFSLLSFETLQIVFVGGAVLSLLAFALRALISRKVWRGAIIMCVSLLAMALLTLFEDAALAYLIIASAMVAVTWISGMDYLIDGRRQLRGRGGIETGDVVRTFGIVLPCLIAALVAKTDTPIWALIALLTCELAVGGLDNLLAHHRATPSPMAWGTRTIGAAALLAGGLAASLASMPTTADVLVVAAATVSLLGTAREFWRGRNYYLDARIREETQVPAPTAKQQSGER